MIAEGPVHQEVSIFRQPDTGDPEAARSGRPGRGLGPRAQRQHGTDLSVAGQVWWHGCFADEAAEGAGSGEYPSEEDVCRGADQGRVAPGSPRGKVVRPSQRREMARKGVAKHGISVRLACVVYGISETCYRYQAELAPSGSGNTITSAPIRLSG